MLEKLGNPKNRDRGRDIPIELRWARHSLKERAESPHGRVKEMRHQAAALAGAAPTAAMIMGRTEHWWAVALAQASVVSHVVNSPCARESGTAGMPRH